MNNDTLARSITVTAHALSVTDEKLLEFDKLARVPTVVRDNKRLFTQLWQTVPDPSYDAILAIEHHPVLLLRFLMSKCQHFSKLSDAIAVMNDEKILVHITELHLYGIFDLDSYINFVRNLYEQAEQPSSYTPKQVSLSGFPQRVVFMCNGGDQITAIILRYCELHFKSKAVVNTHGDKIDIVLQSPIVRNLDEAKKLYENFVEYVGTMEKTEKFGMCQNIKRTQGAEFVISSMGDHSTVTNPLEMLRFLNSHPGPVTLNIINANNVMIGGTNNKMTVLKDKPSENAKHWIMNNVPKHKELKSDYYQRYISANKNGVTERNLSKIVSDNTKCTTLKSHGNTYWVRP
jgi:hypothetical protein